MDVSHCDLVVAAAQENAKSLLIYKVCANIGHKFSAPRYQDNVKVMCKFDLEKMHSHFQYKVGLNIRHKISSLCHHIKNQSFKNMQKNSGLI